jgi:hypothetical protein
MSNAILNFILIEIDDCIKIKECLAKSHSQ